MPYLLAEYCPGPFYYGWWLYERNTNDGRCNALTRNGWGWLGYENELEHVRDLCVSMGYSPPPVVHWSQDFAEWFAATFPGGLRVDSWDDEYPRYTLVEIVAKTPRQCRGVIRTIRGARQSESKRKKRGGA